MENIKATAWAFLVEYHFDEFPIDVLSLNKMNAPFTIRTYEEAKKLIDALELEEYTEKHSGFTVSRQGIITICYDDKLPFSSRDLVIAHEIGHVALKHTVDGYILGKSRNPEKQNEQEKEADIFALALLAPAPVFAEMKLSMPSEISRITRLPIEKAEKAAIEIMHEDMSKKTGIEIDLINHFRASILKYAPSMDAVKQKEEKKNFFFPSIILCALCILIIGISIGSRLNTNYSKLPQPQNQTVVSNVAASVLNPEPINEPVSADAMLAPLQDTDTETAFYVYVSKTGTKYHLPNCSHIANRDNLRKLTLDQANQDGYEPCKTCNPAQ